MKIIKKYQNRIISLLLSFFITSGFSIWALASNPGEIGGQVLKMATDARPVGMGEAFGAVAGDASDIYWNPAGLTRLASKEVSLTHMNRLIDIRSFNFSYGEPINDHEAFGLGLVGLYASDTRRDETTGNDLGKFMDYNTYLALAYARKLQANLSLGLGLKFLYNQLDTYKSSNIVLDASGLYSLSPNINLGLSLQNMALGTRFAGETETVPFNIKTGIAYTPSQKNLSLAADINVPFDSNDPGFNLGAEYWLGKVFAMRAGYQYDTQEVSPGGFNGLSIGWGIKTTRYRLDYAFTPYGDLGNEAHRVTVGAGF